MRTHTAPGKSGGDAGDLRRWADVVVGVHPFRAGPRWEDRFDADAGVLELELGGAAGVSEIVWPSSWGEVDVEADGAVGIAGDVIAWRPDETTTSHRLVARRR